MQSTFVTKRVQWGKKRVREGVRSCRCFSSTPQHQRQRERLPTLRKRKIPRKSLSFSLPSSSSCSEPSPSSTPCPPPAFRFSSFFLLHLASSFSLSFSCLAASTAGSTSAYTCSKKKIAKKPMMARGDKRDDTICCKDESSLRVHKNEIAKNKMPALGGKQCAAGCCQERVKFKDAHTPSKCRSRW